MRHERRRLDADVLGELALARAVVLDRRAEQHPVPEAGTVLPHARVEEIVLRAVREVEASPEGGFHSVLIISYLMISCQSMLGK